MTDDEKCPTCGVEKPIPSGWGIFLESRDGSKHTRIRGPYRHAETAGAVRGEIEQYCPDWWNLKIWPYDTPH